MLASLGIKSLDLAVLKMTVFVFAIKVGTTLMAYEWLSCFNNNNNNNNFISSQT